MQPELADALKAHQNVKRKECPEGDARVPEGLHREAEPVPPLTEPLRADVRSAGSWCAVLHRVVSSWRVYFAFRFALALGFLGISSAERNVPFSWAT
jgi:hypothetical protein